MRGRGSEKEGGERGRERESGEVRERGRGRVTGWRKMLTTSGE